MSGSVDRPVLDHLAVASHRAWDQLERYARQFGGRWLGGPTDTDAADFFFCQVGFAGGTKLELLEPTSAPGSAFLHRFLHRNGPGPHHLTFKVPDIAAAIERAEGAGHLVVNARLDDPDWKEAFLHPKQSHGIVIQLAQQGPDAGWPDPPPLPPTEQGGTTIDRLTHLVDDLDGATAMFADVLAMETVGEGRVDHPLGAAVELRSGPWNLRLVRPSGEAGGGATQWLGDRPGRLLQVEMGVTNPAAIADLTPRGDGWELRPEHNLGTRVLVRRLDPDVG